MAKVTKNRIPVKTENPMTAYNLYLENSRKTCTRPFSSNYILCFYKERLFMYC